MSVSGANLSGNLSFYPPSTTVGGTQGSGDITYHVYCNGKEIATGTVPFKNSRQTVPVSVEKAGYYSFAVSFSNEAGEGPRKRADLKWMGYDTPAAPSTVNLSDTNDGVRITWSSVSSGIHRGTIDTNNRIYRVTRYPDGVVVSPADQKSTSFTDKIDMPAERTKYWYTVEVVTGDVNRPRPSRQSSSSALSHLPTQSTLTRRQNFSATRPSTRVPIPTNGATTATR